MPNRDVLIAKFKQTLDTHKTGYDKFKEGKKSGADPLVQHKLELENKENSAKLKLFYRRLKENVPAEKRAEANARLEEVYKKSFLSAASFESNIKMLSKISTAEKMREYLFHMEVPGMVYERGLGEDFFNVLMEYADISQLDSLPAEIDSYQALELTNFKVYPLKERVEELKKQNAETVEDPLALAALNEELDRISELVVTSTNEYSVANGDAVEKIYSAKISADVNACNQRNVRSEKYKHVDEFLILSRENSSDDLKGTCEVKPEYKEDINLHEAFSAENVKMKIAEDKKEALRNIVRFMKSCGILDGDQTMGENGDKIYGFNQIHAADKKLRKLLEGGSQDLNAYRAAREEYERALENMRRIYKMIEEQIKPTNEMMVGNVSSFREEWIPNEFKNNLLINSYANSIYNLALVIYNGELDIDEFLDNPNKGCIDAMGKLADNLSPGKWLQNQSVSNSIGALLHKTENSKYPPLTISRSAELLLQISGGTEAYEHNAMASMLIASYEFRVQQGIQQNERVGFAGYYGKKPFQTVANILLVNDEDRDYNKLRTFEAITGDFKATIPPFHAMDYCASHVIDPKAVLARINETVTNLAKIDPISNRPVADAETQAWTIRGAQLAAYELMMVHPAPDGELFTTEVFDALKQIVDKPEKAFGGVMNNDVKRELNSLKSMKENKKTIESIGKRAMDAARAEARAAEKAYADSVRSIKDTMGKDEAEKELARLRDAELARLEKAYLAGKLPKDYLDERRYNVEMGDHEKTVPFGASERPSFKKFAAGYAADLKSGELDLEEVRASYDRMMENARSCENQFYMTASGRMPAHEPTAAPMRVEAEPVKEQMSILEVKESFEGPKSPEIKHSDPVATKSTVK